MSGTLTASPTFEDTVAGLASAVAAVDDAYARLEQAAESLRSALAAALKSPDPDAVSSFPMLDAFRREVSILHDMMTEHDGERELDTNTNDARAALHMARLAVDGIPAP